MPAAATISEQVPMSTLLTGLGREAPCKFARTRGARVIGAASARNHEFLRTLGASDPPGLPRGQRASTPERMR
jgi:hypothetical protein